MVLSSWLRAISRLHLVNADSVPGGRHIQTKPVDLGCESAIRLLPSTSTIAILLLLN